MLRRSARQLASRAATSATSSSHGRATAPQSAAPTSGKRAAGAKRSTEKTEQGPEPSVAAPNRKRTKASVENNGSSIPTTSSLLGTGSSLSPSQVVAELEGLLKQRASPARAVQMKKYMRDQYDFYGLQSPERRTVSSEVTASFPPLPTQVWLEELMTLCWAKPQREFQYFAQDYASSLFKSDVAAGKRPRMPVTDSFVDFVGGLICQKSWWDTIDCLSPNIVGPIVHANPHLVAVMDAWAAHENKWLRRSALLHQLKFRTATDFERLKRYILMMAADEDFFIRKAIGWALREYAYTDKAAVRAFVKENEGKLSQLSKREALKHIS